MKSVLKFVEISKMIFSRFPHTPSPPQPQMKFFKNRKFHFFLSKSACWRLWGNWGAPQPQNENFRKVLKFSNTFHTLTVFIRQVLTEIFGLQNLAGASSLLYFDSKYSKFPHFIHFSSSIISASTCRMKTIKV